MRKFGAILYIGCDIPNKNAAAIRVYSNALALKEFGFSVYILSFDHDHDGTEYVNDKLDGISIIRTKYPTNKKEFLSYVFDLNTYKKAIEIIEEECKLEAVIAYDQPSMSFVRVRNLCKKKSIAYICDCAEWHTSEHLNGIAKFLKQLDIDLSMNCAYKKADGVITISSFLERHFSNCCNVICVPPLQYEINVEKTIYPSVAHNKHRYIYAGSPGKNKDSLDVLLASFEKAGTTNCIIEIVGISEEQCIKEWPETEEYINTIRKDNVVNFYGRVPHDTVLSILRTSDFSLIIRESSRKTNAGFPTKFAESVSNGIPVITTKISDLESYVKRFKIGYIVDSFQELPNVIRDSSLMSGSEVNQLKENCRKTECFYYKSHIDELGQFVEKCINA